MTEESYESESSIDNAIVNFGDGKRVEFSRVEFLPDGRLKASLSTPIITDSGQHLGDVTEVAYYAAGVWVSVQPPPQGALIASTTSSQSVVLVAIGITKDRAAQHIKGWLSSRDGAVHPDVSRTADPFGTEFTIYDRYGDMSDARVVQKVRFRWLWPPEHDQTLETRAVMRP